MTNPAYQPADDLRKLEALLFASPEPVAIKALHSRFEDGTDIGALLMDLQQQYDGKGVSLVERDGRWAFRTAPDVADALATYREEERKLSRAALETLAIIAYHQPVSRPEIENIRGVATSKGTLDVLMEMGWIKPGKRRDVPGRPLTWLTTPEFLDHFGLAALTDLPGLDDLKAAGLLDKRPAIDTIRLPSLFDGTDEDGERGDVADDGDEESLFEKPDGTADDDDDCDETLVRGASSAGDDEDEDDESEDDDDDGDSDDDDDFDDEDDEEDEDEEDDDE